MSLREPLMEPEQPEYAGAANEQKHKRQRTAILQRVAEPVHDATPSQPQLSVGTQHTWQKPPMLRIPYELIAFIFKLSLPEMDWDERIVLTRADEASGPPYTEVHLSQVCSHWRSIALDLPDLWTTLRCQGRHYRKPRLPGLRLKTYLKRSGHQLLNIWFDFRHWGRLPDEQEAHIDQLIDLILPHTKRWHRLKILSNYMRPIHYSFQSELQAIETPHLSHFTFCPSCRYDNKPRLTMLELPPQKLHPSMYQIRRGPLNLTSVCLDSTSFWTHLPLLNTVVTLTILGAYISGELTLRSPALLFLLKLPSLANLFIDDEVFTLPEDDPIWETAEMEWPTLQHLHISSGTGLLDILPNIRAPNLQSLTLANLDVFAFDAPTNVYQFPALRNLELLNCNLRDRKIKSWVSSATHFITSVTISDGDDRDASMLISFTDYSEFPTFPWPYLQIASLDSNGLDDPDLPFDFCARIYEAQESLIPSFGTQVSNNSETSKPNKLKISFNGRELQVCPSDFAEEHAPSDASVVSLEDHAQCI